MHVCCALFSDYHANPQNLHINPLQKYKRVNGQKTKIEAADVQVGQVV